VAEGPGSLDDPAAAPGSYADLAAALAEREREFVRRALAAAGGNKVRAAAGAGLSRHAFSRLLRRLGLEDDAPGAGAADG
jgi:DNA-binding NtrC family response regulator